MVLLRTAVLLAVITFSGLTQTTSVQFAPALFYQIPGSMAHIEFTNSGVTAADIDADGFTDVVILGRGGSFVTVFFGDGTGKFPREVQTQITPSQSPPAPAPQLAIADFNRDGHLDLVVSSSLPYVDQVLLGDGTGHFTAGALLDSGRFVNTSGGGITTGGGGTVLVLDLNRDRKLDVVVADSNGTGVNVFLGNGDGKFAAAARYIATGTGGTFASAPNLVAADFNNDGIADLALASGTISTSPLGSRQTSGQIAVFNGRGDGTLFASLVLPTSWFPSNLAAADLNRDGNVDLISIDYDGSTSHVVTRFGNGRSGFNTPVTIATSDYEAMRVDDINGDSIPDVVTTLRSAGRGLSTDTLSILLGRGDGTYMTPVVLGTDPATCLPPNVMGCQFPSRGFELTDVSGDHVPDLIFATLPEDDSLAYFGVGLNTTQSLLSIGTASLPSGPIGKAYSQNLIAGGGVPPYTWSIVSGGLPPGLSLSSSGAIKGVPTAIGSSTFTVQVTDNASTLSTQTLTIVITSDVLTITTATPLPPGAVGWSYSQGLGASGGSPPYTWVLSSGALASGLTLSSAGVITGTPGIAGTSNFTVKVTDNASASAIQTFALTVIAAGTLNRSGVLSHIAAGAGWNTTITLVNTSSLPVQVSVLIHGDDGNILSVPITSAQQGVSQTITRAAVNGVINPNSSLLISVGEQMPSTVSGWAEVNSTGPLSGFAIFRPKLGAGLASEATVPLQSQFPSTFALPFDNTAGFFMGVAIANLSTTVSGITATIWDESGNQIATQNLTIAGSGHTSFILPKLIPVTNGKRGIVRFQSTAPGGIAGLGLRFSPFETFTSVPSILQ